MAGPTRVTDETGGATHPALPEPVDPGPQPGLVLAWGPAELTAHDRAPLAASLVVGRSASCEWCLEDHMLSRTHFVVAPAGAGRHVLRDLGSRNGVFLDGERVAGEVELRPGAVVRAGGCLFVMVEDLGRLGPPDADEDVAMGGRFHTWALRRALRVAARSGQPVLLEGESGVGKELAALELHRLNVELGRDGALQLHNAACFAGEDDAVGHLFGVTRGAFTGVDARTGALEAAEAGTLFLDEVHALPLRVQRSLLRFVEDGLVEPLGQAATGPRRRLDVRLVFGTNVDVEEACEKGWLAHDLVARLHRVSIPPLRERRADVPSLFLAVLRRTVAPAAAEAIARELRVETVERLCLRDYRLGNVRELVRLGAIAAARLAEGESPAEALRGALRDAGGERPSTAAPPAACAPGQEPPGPEAGSSYERHRAEILAAYAEVGGNLSRMEAMLKQRGVPCTRRWLAHFLDRWGVRPIPKRG